MPNCLQNHLFAFCTWLEAFTLLIYCTIFSIGMYSSNSRSICLISTPFKTFHSTEYFTLSKGLSVLCPWSQPDAFPLLAVHNCLTHTYTAIWKPALQSKQQNIKHCSNKGSLIQQFFKYHYFSNQDGWCK